MSSWSSIFWLIVLVIIFYVGFKVVPIYYRGIIGIRGVCQENADLYHKYHKFKGSRYIEINIAESLDKMGIPPDKRHIGIRQGSDTIYITITYKDRANFQDYYTKDFEFQYECEGVLSSVYHR